MLYEFILRLEKQIPGFNTKLALGEDIVTWAEQCGILVLDDRSISAAVSLKYKRKNIILVNPWICDHEKVLAIGHELGHHVLGHVDSEQELHFDPSSLFSHWGTEKDASIIGHLCLIPTTTIIRLAQESRLNVEELYNELYPWMEADEEIAMKICEARMRIFGALVRARESRGLKL